MQNLGLNQTSGHDGYIVEVGGRIVCEYHTLAAALSAGLHLKRQDADAEVKVYEARDRLMERVPA